MLDELRRAGRGGERRSLRAGTRRGRDSRANERQPVPLRRLREHRPRGAPGRRGGAASTRPFTYERPGDPPRRSSSATSTDGATYLAGGTNLVDLMKLGVSRPTCSSTSAASVRRHRRRRRRRAAHRRAGANSDLAGTRRSRAATRVRRRCWRAPPGSCATCATVPGTCCSAPVAATSRTSPSRATSAYRVGLPGTRGRAPRPRDPGCDRRGASPPIRPTWPWPWPCWTLRCTGAHGDGRDHPDRRLLPAARRPAGSRHGSSAGRLITAVELPPLPWALRVALPQGSRPRSFAFGSPRSRRRWSRRRPSATSGWPRRRRAEAVAGPRAEARAARRPATEETFARPADAELSVARPLPGNGLKVPLVRQPVVGTVARDGRAMSRRREPPGGRAPGPTCVESTVREGDWARPVRLRARPRRPSPTRRWSSPTIAKGGSADRRRTTELA